MFDDTDTYNDPTTDADGWGPGFPDHWDYPPGAVAAMFREDDGDPSTMTWLDPGGELATLVDCKDPADMSGYDLVGFIASTERLISWATSRQHDGIRELAQRRPAPNDPLLPGGHRARPGPARLHGDSSQPSVSESEASESEASESGVSESGVSEFAADEIAATLHVTRNNADRRLDLALSLGRLPRTAQALAAGSIDVAKARAVAEATAVLPDQAARWVEDRVIDRAPGQSPRQFDAALRRAVIAQDPAAAQARRDDATKARAVALYPEPDGAATLRATGPAEKVLALLTALTGLALAAKTPKDTRTLDQRRFDALIDLAMARLETGSLPTTRRRPHINVTVGADTLLGLNDNPGELTGYGPITAAVARAIAGDADWTRLLTDPATGALLDYGTTTYRPPTALANHVLARDKTCRHYGCNQPATRCELDHAVPYPEGPTAADNLYAECTHHHRLKHHTAWTVAAVGQGGLVWTSPTGHSYPVPPEPVLGDPPTWMSETPTPMPTKADTATSATLAPSNDTAPDGDVPPF